MKILVDGFNLALEKGTGVATYARNLTYCVRAWDMKLPYFTVCGELPIKHP